MMEEQDPARSGANIVAGVDIDEGTTRRERAARRKRTTPTPFNGLPIIYGAIGYMALAIVAAIAAALSISGVGLWPLVLMVLVCVLGSWIIRRCINRRW